LESLFKCVAVAILLSLASGCIPLMALGSASSLYGYHKDHQMDTRITALELRSKQNFKEYAYTYTPYVPSIFRN